MNAAAPFPWSARSARANAKTTFRTVVEHAPIPVAGCRSQGVIVEMNPPFERTDPSSCDAPTPSAGPLVQQKSVQQEFQEIKKESLL